MNRYLVVFTYDPKQYYQIGNHSSLESAQEEFDIISRDPNIFAAHLLKAEVINSAGKAKNVLGWRTPDEN